MTSKQNKFKGWKKEEKDKKSKATVPFWNKPNPVPTRLCHVKYNRGDIKVGIPTYWKYG